MMLGIGLIVVGFVTNEPPFKHNKKKSDDTQNHSIQDRLDVVYPAVLFY